MNLFYSESGMKKEKIKLFEKQNAYTAPKMKFYIKYFFRKCDQIRRKLRIWSHLLKESLMEKFILCAVIFLLMLNKAQIDSSQQLRNTIMGGWGLKFGYEVLRKIKDR